MLTCMWSPARKELWAASRFWKKVKMVTCTHAIVEHMSVVTKRCMLTGVRHDVYR